MNDLQERRANPMPRPGIRAAINPVVAESLLRILTDHEPPKDLLPQVVALIRRDARALAEAA